MEESAVVRLAKAQLAAYCRADLDAFLACYAEDVIVLDEAGKITIEGRETMRERYGQLFATFRDVHAIVDARLAMGRHCVDRERWSRVSRATGERSDGEILVRYTERAGLIAVVEFLR